MTQLRAPRKSGWTAVFMPLAIGALSMVPPEAQAHPHVWVNVETTVLYEGGKVAGFKHRWAFDDMYTAMAIQGLDKNGDGTYSRDEGRWVQTPLDV